MKLLFDFFPIILFFTIYKFAESHATSAALWATTQFGWLVAGGVIETDVAPILLATGAAIVATIAQVAYLIFRNRKVDTMLWVNLAVIAILGGATIWLHSDTFIKWKPTVLYWAFALILGSGLLVRRLFLQTLMGAQITLPEAVWLRLTYAWMGFFVLMGWLNLYVAFNFSQSTWVSFKLFGGIGLLLLFALAQGVYLSRFMDAESQSGHPGENHGDS